VNSRILVTGAAGFIGSTAVRTLLDLEYEVVGVDSFSSYYDPALKRANVASLPTDRLTFVEGDLNELPLDELLRGVDSVVHLAGQPGVRASWGNEFGLYTRDNVDATQRLLEAARGSSRLRRFVYGSSSSVYGQAESYPTAEDTLPRPFSPYGVTKLAGEHLVTLYRENFGVPTSSFRFFTVYGPRQRPDMAFTRFLNAALSGDPITVYGDGSQIRDFTYVDDIVAAIVESIARDGDLPSVMNLAGGSSVSVIDVLHTVQSVSGATLDVQHLPAISGDVTRTGGSIDLAKSALGWTPQVNLDEGLRRQFAWIRQA
jgi:UDP-glucuronate 4-epimerase